MSKQSDRRRRVVRATAPAAGLLAAGLLVWQGSYAAFSATTVDTNNAWSSGSLALTEQRWRRHLLRRDQRDVRRQQPQARCDRHHLPHREERRHRCRQPGDVRELDCWTRRRRSGAQIQLTVTAGVPASDVQANCVGFPASGTTPIATNQPLSTFAATYATGVPVAVASGTVLEAYKVTWTFVSTGTNPGDSALMGKTVTSGFTWELQ